jgi:site-specific recombinase XerD
MAAEIELKSAHTQFVEYLSNRKKARATIIAYSKDIDQLMIFIRDLGKKHVHQIEKDELSAFLDKLGKDGYTPKSVSRKINSIKTFYRFLKSNGHVDTDPSVNIVHPKYEIKPPMILSKVEYRALRDTCRDDARTSAIVELFLQTGLRIGELAALALHDIKDTELNIKAQESHEERMVPLNKAAKSAIDRYLQVRPKTQNPTLFVTKTGKPLLIRNIRTAIDRYFKIAGIENAKVNDLRNTFIAHHLMSGTPLNVISKLVGHKRLSTTEKYLDFIKGKTAEKSIRLEEL